MGKKRLYASHIRLSTDGAQEMRSSYSDTFKAFQNQGQPAEEEQSELKATLRQSHFTLGHGTNEAGHYDSEMKRNFVPLDGKEARTNAVDATRIRQSSILLSSSNDVEQATDYQRHFRPFTSTEQSDARQQSVELGLRDSHIQITSGGTLPEDRLSVTQQDFIKHQVRDERDIRYVFEDEDEED